MSHVHNLQPRAQATYYIYSRCTTQPNITTMSLAMQCPCYFPELGKDQAEGQPRRPAPITNGQFTSITLIIHPTPPHLRCLLWLGIRLPRDTVLNITCSARRVSSPCMAGFGYVSPVTLAGTNSCLPSRSNVAENGRGTFAL